MSSPIPIITSIKTRSNVFPKRIQRSIGKIAIKEGVMRGSPQTGNAAFEWMLAHGNRQGGLIRGIQIKMGKDGKSDDSVKLLKILQSAFANYQNPEIQNAGREMLADYYLAAGAAAGSEGKSIKVRPPTPLEPEFITRHDLSSPRAPEKISLPGEFPKPPFVWMSLDITETTKSILRCSIEQPYKLVCFDEIDSIAAMGSINNLATPYTPSTEG